MPPIKTREEIRWLWEQLLTSGVVDRVLDIDYAQTDRQQVDRKHFGTSGSGRPTITKAIRSGGTIFSLEEVPGDQQPDYSWISAGIDMLQKHPQIMPVRPLAGPPTTDGTIKDKGYTRDPEGFYKFKFFSSRVYLIDRKRFDRLLI